MTETEWFACDDPGVMLDWLPGRVSDRKLRLFAVACCYLSNRGVFLEPYIAMYESVVRFVDGAGTLDAVRGLWSSPNDPSTNPTWPERAHEWGRDFATIAVRQRTEPDRSNEHFPSVAELLELIGEVFGNSFRPVPFDPAWRTSTAVALAERMHSTNEFSAMPILADALQDAGCDNDEVLRHCRDPREHVRGCWVVDLVLGKK